jgi:RNA polymerase sigma factor for flagellar operon FliA
MHDPLSPEALFLEHVGWIDKVASMICGRYRIWGDEAEEFAASVKIRLMKDDYAAIRRFRGESGFQTYLASVVTRQFHDSMRERLGRWRPSAAAERLGPPAGELEALVHRDGYRLDQAGEKLRTAGRTTLSDHELARLLARLPSRAPLRPVEVAADAVLLAAEGRSRADEGLAAAEADARRGEVMGALERVLGELDTEDRLIVQMHFGDRTTLADVARVLGVEQKPLYRRVERLRARLQKLLESEGVRRADVRGVLGEEGDA